MATLKRNHTPSNTTCECSACGVQASAPAGRSHRHCKKGKRVGRWIAVG